MTTFVQIVSFVPLIRCMHVDGEGVKQASVLARTLFWVLIPHAITPPDSVLVSSSCREQQILETLPVFLRRQVVKLVS